MQFFFLTLCAEIIREKARGMNPAELRVIDGSLRQELVNKGFFERFNKKTR